MTQYLLSVWHDRDATPEDIYPDPEEREASYAATGRFNEEIQASGNWVFAGGLHSPRERSKRRSHCDPRTPRDTPASELYMRVKRSTTMQHISSRRPFRWLPIERRIGRV